MIAPFRLAITADGTRIVKDTDAKAAFLVATAGSEIKKEYEDLVCAFLAGLKEKEVNPAQEPDLKPTEGQIVPEPIQGRQKRIPRNLRFRGAKKQHTEESPGV